MWNWRRNAVKVLDKTGLLDFHHSQLDAQPSI
jgi:hypothetical protein